MIEQIKELYPEEEFLITDGFNDAIIGIAEDSNKPIRLIYSVSKCLEILEKDMQKDDALEYFTFNISSAYVGDKTPIWCWDNFV